MHMKNPLLFGLMAIILLSGTITPVLGQTTNDSEIKINEIELNPAGSDAGLGTGGSGINSKTSDGISGSQEYVELYNPTQQEIDISGWLLVPTATWKKYEIPANTIISPESFLIFSHVNYWFKDFGDSLSLYDDDGNLIDETPLLKDNDDMATSWQRVTDGIDTNSITDWELKRMTPKSSNGQIEEIQTYEFLLSSTTDKSNYTLGDNLTISGTVSEVLTSPSTFYSEIVKINVSGPNYFKNLAIFPDKDLNFSTSLSLQPVLGFNEGEYNVDISYGEHSSNINFSINEKTVSSSSQTDTEIIEIFTDKSDYMPGENVILFANTDSSIEYGGLEYTVKGPNGDIIFAGTIFPNTEFSKVFKQGGGQLYPFSTELFMSPINPIYGTYEISADFKAQNSFATDNEISATTTFNLVEDIKEDKAISLFTDKDIYSIDDVIKITGRSNNVWTDDLELTITQTNLLSEDAIGADARYVAKSPFTLTEFVPLDGDGRFSFELKLLDDSSKDENYANLYGDYKISISEYFGNSSLNIKVVADPQNFNDQRTPLGLKMTESNYVLGTKLKVSGTVMNYDYKPTNNMRNSVEITISDSNGKVISYVDHQGNAEGHHCFSNDCDQFSKPLVYTALPDLVGSFSVDLILQPNQFDYGTYTIHAKHQASGNIENIDFRIISAQDDILPQTETELPLTLEFEKDVYYVGEKLEIEGNVILKDPRAFTDSSMGTSAQEQEGSSYTTNYAQAALNYVEVSIPYPKTMVVTKSAAWKTTPNEGENYTGGGGSGVGGSYYKDKDGNVIRGDEDKSSDRGDDSKRTGYDGTAVLQKHKKLLTDMNFKAYPDENGNYSGTFELRAGVFSTGTYSVKANYYGHYIEKTVNIIDNSLKGGLSPELVFNFDRTEYIPGEIVKISGIIENAYYYDNISILVETPDISKINCLVGQQCGSGNSEKDVRVHEGVEGPQFFMNYRIPDNPESVGTYNVVVDTHFGKLEKQFIVIPKSDIMDTTPDDSISTTPTKIIKKFNRIPDKEIPIVLTEQYAEDTTLVPRVIQGSLFTSARGEESNVNLRISTTDGQCVIGQDSDCMVTESTRKPGAIYSVVSIDDINYKIRYSGNDVRLEKFSIVPEESNSQIDVDNWKVEVIKDEQPSRFYYKVSYIALE